MSHTRLITILGLFFLILCIVYEMLRGAHVYPIHIIELALLFVLLLVQLLD